MVEGVDVAAVTVGEEEGVGETIESAALIAGEVAGLIDVNHDCQDPHRLLMTKERQISIVLLEPTSHTFQGDVDKKIILVEDCQLVKRPRRHVLDLGHHQDVDVDPRLSHEVHHAAELPRQYVEQIHTAVEDEQGVRTEGLVGGA